MDTPAAAVDYGCKVSTKHGAIQANHVASCTCHVVCGTKRCRLERIVRLHAGGPWKCSRNPCLASPVKATNSDSCTGTTSIPWRLASAGTADWYFPLGIKSVTGLQLLRSTLV